MATAWHSGHASAHQLSRPNVARQTVCTCQLGARHIGSLQRRAVTARAGRRPVKVSAAKVLIVNTKGGAHAFIGLHLAKHLLKSGHMVTVFNDGDKGKLTGKDPYSQYQALEQEGAQIIFGDAGDPSSIPVDQAEIVYDNNAKALDVNKGLIDAVKANGGHFVFVSSAGAYDHNPVEPMHVEGDPRKASAGHVAVEDYLERSGIPYTVFQPQYIYGPYTAKDCEQWFVDRIIRDRPVPIPGDGLHLTNLTHVDDVANMLALVPGNAAAQGQHFNVVSDRYITFDGIVRIVAGALGKEPKIVHYDPAKLGLGKGEGFPFRTMHFFATSSKAKCELGWQPRHTLADDIGSLIESYKAAGRDKQDVDFSVDEKILSAAG